MSITHSTAARNAAADAVVDRLDLGPGAARVQITKTADDYTGANLLADITLADPAFGAAAAGVATAGSLPKSDSSADNTGTALQFRAVQSDGTEEWKGTVTATGGGGDMEMLSTAITAGEAVQLTALTYTAPV